MWGLIAAGVASIIGGIIQNHANKKAAAKQNAANLELSKYTAEQNQASIDKQNAYNAPTNQLQRYTEAGLNPNLIYGSGAASAGQQQSAAHMDTPSAIVPANRVPMLDAIGMYQDFQLKQASIDSLKAQTLNSNARTETERFNALLRESQGKTADFDLDTKDMLRPYSLQIKEQNVRQGRAQLDKTMQEISNLRKDQFLKELVAKQKQQDLSMFSGRRKLQDQSIRRGQLQNEYSEMGVGNNDNFFIRVLGRAFQQYRK